MADNTTLEALLKQVLLNQEQQAEEIRAQRLEIATLKETVIRMETHGYHEQIKDLREEAKFLRDEMIVMKTKGQVFSAGVAAGISVVVSVVAGLVLWAVKN